VRPELVQIGIDRLGDGKIAAEEMDHRRRGHGDLGRSVGMRLQEGEGIGRDAVRAPYLGVDMRDRRGKLVPMRVGELESEVGEPYVGAAQLEHEILPPGSATKLAVGYGLQAD